MTSAETKVVILAVIILLVGFLISQRDDWYRTGLTILESDEVPEPIAMPRDIEEPPTELPDIKEEETDVIEGVPEQPTSTIFREPPFDVTNTFAPVGATLLGQNSVTYNPTTATYSFTYRDTSGILRTEYEIEANHPWTLNGMIRIRETRTNSFPVYDGGVSYRKLDGSILSPWTFSMESGTVTRMQHRLLSNNVVRFSFEQTLDGVTTYLNYDYWIMGKTLGIHVYATNPRRQVNGNYQSIHLTGTQDTPNPRQFIFPYAEQVPIIIVDNRYFISNYFEWSKSNFNSMLQNVNWNGNPGSNGRSMANGFIPWYVADQAGNMPPFDETGYITVSDNVYDVMMNIYKQKPPYRDQIANRVTFDLDTMYGWMGLMRAHSAFSNAKVLLDIFYQFGMRDLWVNLHGWHFGGAENTLPTHYPADIALGGGEDLRAVSEAASQYGYLFGLYVAFRDMYDASPYWNPDHIALNPDGTRRSLPSSYGGTAYRLKADKMQHYASLNLPLMKEDYNINSIFIDITTTMQFYDFLDYAANAHPTARTIKGVFEISRNLNTYIRNTVQGPVEGEATVHPLLPATYYAGSIESEERELLGRQCGKIIPDFELKIVKPLMVGKGMGLYPRWPNCQVPYGYVYTDADEWVYRLADQYRATAVAYGHAGYLYDQGFFFERNIPCTFSDCPFPNKFLKISLREYFLMKELQKQYLQANVLQIRYKLPTGEFVDINNAIRNNVDFGKSQLYIEYDNGLRIYVNRHPVEALSVNVDGRSYTLPPDSYIAWNTNVPGYNNYGTFLTYSAITPTSGGRRVDYINSPAYVMADGRGTNTDFGNIQTRYFKAITSEVNPLLTITEDASGVFNNFQWPRSAVGWFVASPPPLRIQGTALDPNSLTRPVTVKFYVDGPKDVGEYIGSTVANLPGYGNPPGYPQGNYGLELAIPQHLASDGKPHVIYSYVVDNEENIDIPISHNDPPFFNLPTTPDTTPPTVSLSAPADGKVHNPGTVFFSAYARDNVFLKKATLYISLQGYKNRNSVWTAVQTVWLTPHQETSMLFTLHDLPDNAQFKWNVEVCDFANNCASAQSNWGVSLSESGNPSVALYSPVHNARLTRRSVEFVGYAASRIPLAGAMLYAIVEGREIPLLFNTLSGKFSQIRFTVPVQIPDGQYEWNIRVCNINSQCASAQNNYRFSIISDPAPTVTLINPPNGYQTASQTITFTGTVTDNGQLRDASLYADYSGQWTAIQTIPLSGSSASPSFTINNIPPVTFQWSIQACDTNGNCAFAPERRTASVVLGPPPGPTVTLIGPPDQWLLLSYNFLTFAGFAVSGGRPLSSATLYTSATGQWEPLGSPIQISGNAASFSFRRQTTLPLPIRWNFKVCDTSTPQLCSFAPVDFTLATTPQPNPSPSATIAWPYNMMRINKVPTSQAYIIAAVRSSDPLRSITLYFEIEGRMQPMSVINNPSTNTYNAIFTLPGSPQQVLLHYNVEACTTNNVCSFASPHGFYLDIQQSSDNHPTVRITSPQNGAVLSGSTTTVTASASDDIGINRVEFYIDNTLQATDTTPPYTYNMNVQSLASGYYLITAKAYDTIEQFTAYQILIRRT